MGATTRIVHVVPPTEVRPALQATKEQLVSIYRGQASAVRSVNATVEMVPSAGSDYSGVIQQYQDVGGFILATRPEMIRIIGQLPVVHTDIFDTVSDGQVFRMFIPSKSKFWRARHISNAPRKTPLRISGHSTSWMPFSGPSCPRVQSRYSRDLTSRQCAITF